ncbi:ribulose-phosphate 3-epimerase, partial [Patescibacteria group bacterium]
VIKAIQDGEVSVGMVMNPATPWKAIEPYVELLDFVQFMTVEPGFNGAPFIPSVIEKIADFHFYYPDKPISVDGGVTPDKIEVLEQAGVTRATVGSAIEKFNV